jgi:hypothetical protein
MFHLTLHVSSTVFYHSRSLVVCLMLQTSFLSESKALLISGQLFVSLDIVTSRYPIPGRN